MTDRTLPAKEMAKFRKELRQAVADYMYSEGCSCCRDTPAHDEHKARLGKLLRVRSEDAGMKDGSRWYDFSKFRSKK